MAWQRRPTAVAANNRRNGLATVYQADLWPRRCMHVFLGRCLRARIVDTPS